jgi:predicted dehydrogenase
LFPRIAAKRGATISEYRRQAPIILRGEDVTSGTSPGIGIIGCGLVGRKRAQALGSARLVACADPIAERAHALASAHPGASATVEWQRVLERSEVEIIMVSTTHDALAAITRAALQAGKHVLVEKPAGRSSAELLEVINLTRAGRLKVRVGFNHRYHPALRRAREIVAAGSLGDLMFVRARYGHGGRKGYETEWRANPMISGGGELLDQGVHLIDLARWFLGDFTEITGFADTFFWNMPVEDNGFLLLKTPRRQVAFLHASWTEWKNLFSFEIYGKAGKLHIQGLGGSYGVERLAHHRMLPDMGLPETTIWEYTGPDTSWSLEFDAFLKDIALDRPPDPGLHDAVAALKVVESVYAGGAVKTPARMDSQS